MASPRRKEAPRARAMTLPGLATRPAWQGQLRLFGDNNSNKVPVLLEDGTSVQFPKGWSDEDADKWRKGMELQRPLTTQRVPMT